jgi:cell division septation protein DedD
MSDPIWNESSYEARSTKESILTSKWFTIALAVLAGVIGLVILYYLFYPSAQKNNKNYVIGREELPLKQKPANLGGVQFPHQDKVVYENLLGKNRAVVEPEEEVVLSNDPEKPMEIIQRTAPVNTEERTKQPLTVEEITPVIEKVVVEEPVIVATPPSNPVMKPAPKQANKREKVYRVQLASFPNKKRAEMAWNSLKRKHKKLVASEKMMIDSKTIPGKGTFYRVQVGAFPTHDQATTFCNKIKADKGQCFVAK